MAFVWAMPESRPIEIDLSPLTFDKHQPLSPADKRRTDLVRINEIFYSIQGESSKAGERCVFVRLTGCGLRCTYCDTEYAFYEGEDMSINDVVAKVKSYGCNLVELTGGEPLEQEAVYTVIDRLLAEGFELMIETGGHMDVSRVDTRVKRIVDFKTPYSGMSKRNRYDNVEHLTKHDEVKFVIGSREDFEWSKEKVEEYELDKKVETVLFSPVWGQLQPIDLANWIMQEQVPVRFQLQLHKILWTPETRAV
jgi:7-carboxy-7-deazaguanine synthase